MGFPEKLHTPQPGTWLSRPAAGLRASDAKELARLLERAKSYYDYNNGRAADDTLVCIINIARGRDRHWFEWRAAVSQAQLNRLRDGVKRHTLPPVQ